MRMTEVQHQDRLDRLAGKKVSAPAPEVKTKAAPPGVSGNKSWQAKGRLPKGEMNETERAFARRLDAQILAGEILWYKFHPLRVRLASNTYYEVDFLVMLADGEIAIYETKGGYTSDKGQLKIKLCAEALPVFRMFKAEKLKEKEGGGWKITEYNK